MRAHPRSRGENSTASRASRCSRGSSPLTRGKHPQKAPKGTHTGSSPLTRGKHRPQAHQLQRRGLIPAHAGKTTRTRSACTRRWAHPRSRGENGIGPEVAGDRCGSSPLTRGKLLVPGDGEFERRLIPAHAGKTAWTSEKSPSFQAHPRSRGENQELIKATGAVVGSSPLTRGKPGQWVRRDATRGLIPAHAGKTR